MSFAEISSSFRGVSEVDILVIYSIQPLNRRNTILATLKFQQNHILNMKFLNSLMIVYVSGVEQPEKSTMLANLREVKPSSSPSPKPKPSR
jgi:hypothetical protein